ncbi:MAG: chromosomal replication initiator protein DnaA [bacterium]
MLERWEFIHFPCMKDSQRYKLKLKADEDNLRKIVRMLSANSGRPFASLSHEYNWGVYFYSIDENEKRRITDTLKRICNQGNVSQSEVIMGQELPPMFEEFLEATAKELKGNTDTVDGSLQMEELGSASVDKSSEGSAIKEDNNIISGDKNSENADQNTRMQPSVEISELNDRESESVQKDDWSIGSPEAPEPDKILAKDDEASFKNSDSKETASSKSMGNIETRTFLNKNYTLNEFVVGSNNRFTHAAAKAVAENPGKIYNPLFIYGGVGLGKTHLMHAVGHYVLEKSPSINVVYVTTERFMSEVIEAIGKGEIQSFREKYRSVDLLLIDDIQFLSESESTQEEFFHTFNMLHESARQIIITSDRPPKQLSTLEDRLRSRFEWGLIADIKSPTLETRVAILKRKNEGSNVSLDDNILLYIASKLKSNIRELEGFLKRVNAYAALTGQEVDMESVKSIMRELLPEDEIEEEDKVIKDTDILSQAFAEGPAMTQQENVQANPAPKGQLQPEPSFVHEPLVNFMEGFSAGETTPSSPQNDQYKSPELQQPGTPNFQQDQPFTQQQQFTPPPPPPPQFQTMSAPPPPPPPPQMQQAPTIPPPVPVQLNSGNPSPGFGVAGLKNDGVDQNLVPIEVAFFYPEGKDKEFSTMKEKFRQVIKKHKLKFRFESIFERGYNYGQKINYAFFTELCKTNNVRIVIFLGAPPNQNFTSEDSSNLLGAMMEDDKISMQYVPWNELNKDYRYLNLALDITLLRNKKV